MNTERKEEMEMDAIAAAARLALLGTSAELAVPFEELKPEIRERWGGVVRVVQGQFWEELDALKVGWANSHKAEEECERLRVELEGVKASRPKGLPSIDHLEAIFDNAYGATKSDYKAIEAILAVLAPYLREPTGWELDVTAEELYAEYCGTPLGNQLSWKAVLDLCRSRIRPVFECKECATRAEAMMKPQPEVRCAGCLEKDNKIHSLRQYYSDVQSKINDLRTALGDE